MMAYIGTKGYFIAKLKEKGIRKHPVELRKLESYKTAIVRNLYFDVYKEENK